MLRKSYHRLFLRRGGGAADRSLGKALAHFQGITIQEFAISPRHKENLFSKIFNKKFDCIFLILIQNTISLGPVLERIMQFPSPAKSGQNMSWKMRNVLKCIQKKSDFFKFSFNKIFSFWNLLKRMQIRVWIKSDKNFIFLPHFFKLNILLNEEIWKITFAYVSAHCASFKTKNSIWPLLRRRGVCRHS